MLLRIRPLDSRLRLRLPVPVAYGARLPAVNHDPKMDWKVRPTHRRAWPVDTAPIGPRKQDFAVWREFTHSA